MQFISRFIPRRFRDSSVYETYLYIRRKRAWQSRRDERAFYSKFLDSERRWPLVFDVGANSGDKAIIFSDIAEKVVCVEPDTACVEMLKERFSRRHEIVIESVAVSDTIGQTSFYRLQPESPYNTLSDKWRDSSAVHQIVGGETISIRTRTLDDLILQYGVPDYIKIDVEGYELQAISGLSQKIKLVSFEANLPDFRDETIACISRLVHLNGESRFNFIGNTDPNWQLRLPEWVSGSDMTEIVSSSKDSYMEVYSRAT